MFANPITTRAETSMSASGLILTFLRLPKRFRLTSDSCSIILGFPPNPKVVRERQVQCRRCSDTDARACQCWSWASVRRSAPRSAPALMREPETRLIYIFINVRASWQCGDLSVATFLNGQDSVSSFIHYNAFRNEAFTWIGYFHFTSLKVISGSQKHDF